MRLLEDKMSNPYADMVNDRLGERFIIRNDGCYDQVLRNALQMRPKPSLVFGLHGMGKTCMAWKLKSEIEKRGGYQVLYIDAHILGRKVDASRKLFGKIACFIEGSPDHIDHPEGYLGCTLEQLQVVLRKAKMENRSKFIVIIDSLCHELHNEERDEFFDKIVAFVDAIGMSECEDVIHLIFFARRSAEMIQSRTGASYLSDKCESYPLRPFSRGETEELCRFSQQKVEVENLWLLSGGWPKHVVTLLIIMNDENVDVTCAYRSCKKSILKDYDQVAKFFHEFYGDDDPLPLDFRRMGVENCLDCLVWRELYNVRLPQTVCSLFEEYGLGDERLPDCLGNFKLYLMSSQDVGSLLLELERLELDLRSFIDHRLCDFYKTKDWIYKVEISEEENWEHPDQTGKKPNIVKTLTTWMKRECKKYPDASKSPLDYAYPNDLCGFMYNIRLHWEGKKEWVGFCRHFDGKEDMFLDSMQAFGAIRNPAHHCRRPPKELINDFDGARMFLRKYIPSAE